jgi:hypothetical protein
MNHEQTQSALPDAIDEALAALLLNSTFTRSGIDDLTKAVDQIPDYTLTLSEVRELLARLCGGFERVAGSSFAKLSPEALTNVLIKASAEVRAEDRALLQQHREMTAQALGRINGIVERGQAADQQLRWLIWSGVGGLLMGVFFWSILPGAVARSLPVSWHVPEWMAARTMGMERREAGARLIAISDAEASRRSEPRVQTPTK